MKLFRLYLVVALTGLAIYTLIVGSKHSWDLFPVFFGDIAAMNWPGQFNLDFMCLLTFSGLWLAWRHHFTLGGIALGMLGIFGGTMVLAPYLLIMTVKTSGDMKEILIGRKRVNS